MDFIDGLPKSQGKDVILVVVERFTKSTHFIALSYPYTTTIVVDMFLKRAQTLHGIPTSIVTNRDKVFLSNFWELCSN